MDYMGGWAEVLSKDELEEFMLLAGDEDMVNIEELSKAMMPVIRAGNDL